MANEHDPMVMTLARQMMPLSTDDKLVALAWIERATGSGADDIDRGLLANVLDGTFAFTVKDGQMLFSLTDKGKTEADAIVAHSPEAQRMLAELLGATRVDEPKEPQ